MEGYDWGILGFAAVAVVLSIVSYFTLKSRQGQGEEQWNGRILFSDSREIRDSDIKSALFSAVVMSIVFLFIIIRLIQHGTLFIV